MAIDTTNEHAAIRKSAIIAIGSLILGTVCGHLTARLTSGDRPDPVSLSPEPARVDESIAQTEPPSAKAEPPQWSLVESDDPFKLIGNLRGAGCPETIIAAIVRARVAAGYQSRIDKITDPLAKYWSTSAELAAGRGKIEELVRERDHYLYEELKLERPVIRNASDLSPEK